MINSCTLSSFSKRKENKVPRQKHLEYLKLDKRYENKYFTINHPKGWKVIYKHEKVSDTSNDEYREYDIINQQEDGRWFKPQIKIVPSIFKFGVSLREWANMSIWAKDNQDNIMQYVGHTDIDSFTFSKYPALCVSFIYRNELNDTIIQQQIIVKKELGNNLFYVNLIFNKKEYEAWFLGARMLNTFKIK